MGVQELVTPKLVLQPSTKCEPLGWYRSWIYPSQYCNHQSITTLSQPGTIPINQSQLERYKRWLDLSWYYNSQTITIQQQIQVGFAKFSTTTFNQLQPHQRVQELVRHNQVVVLQSSKNFNPPPMRHMSWLYPSWYDNYQLITTTPQKIQELVTPQLAGQLLITTLTRGQVHLFEGARKVVGPQLT